MGETKVAAPQAEGIVVIYDGDCPFCSQYVKMTRLRESVGKVVLVNARDPDLEVQREVQRVTNLGFDLNDGMAAVYRGQIYHGHHCLNLIAGLTTASGPFNRLNALIFRNKRTSQFLYPLLRAGRNATLRALGRSKIPATTSGN